MHPEETRVAIVHDGRLMELNIEISGKEQIKGNIYKGVVLRVEPGLQAAFVDIGRAKPGFLQIGELHPDYWEWRDDIPEEQRKRRPRIKKCYGADRNWSSRLRKMSVTTRAQRLPATSLCQVATWLSCQEVTQQEFPEK
jgi:Rne/Rng family ribonuclease